MKDIDWDDFDDDETIEEPPYELLGYSRIDGYPILKVSKENIQELKEFRKKLDTLYYYGYKVSNSSIKIPEWDDYENFYIIRIGCPKEKVFEHFNLKDKPIFKNYLHDG